MPTIKKIANNKYQARVRVTGVGSACLTMPTRALAERWASQTHHKMLEGKYFGQGYVITFKELIAKYRVDIAPRKHKDKTIKANEAIYKYWTAQLGHKTLATVKAVDIREQRDNLDNENATKNRYTAVLSGILKYAVQCEYIDTNPCSRIEKLKENKNKGKVLSQYQIISLLNNASPKLYNFIKFALSTGARLGEIEKLERSNYMRNTDRYITFTNTKNGEDRTIPLDEDVFILIDFLYSSLAWPRGPMFGVFPRKEWTELKAKVHMSDIRFHDLRHTFITRKIAEGVPKELVAAYVGHKTLAMTDHYTHLSADDLKSVIGS